MGQTTGAETAILIAAYNAATTLDRAVASALEQAETAEVCIVDDGSTDATAALAHAWAERDRRVTLRRLTANAGPAAARNEAIASTRAGWITILDADDYLLPGRLATLHAQARDADFVADALIRTPDGAAPRVDAELFAPAPLSFEAFVLGNLGARRGPLDLGFLKPMFRRSFVDTHQLAYRTDMRLGEDYEFYARALALGARFLVGGAAGYVSVERPGSLSKRHGAPELLALRDCDDDLAKIRAFTPAERRALKRHWRSADCRLQWVRLIEAVKTRDLGAALATFHTPQSALFLTGRLAEQAWVRAGAWLKRIGTARAARAH